MNCKEPIFLKKDFPKDNVYDYWLSHIIKIERLMSVDNGEIFALEIGYMLFPLIDTVSYTLFGVNGRKYLEELGVEHAYLVYKMFRNGLLHNLGSYTLEYEDGNTVEWAMHSSSGTHGLPHYDPGYISKEYPEDNYPGDVVFMYHEIDGTYFATLFLDTLLMKIKYDLEERKKTDDRTSIKIIEGQKLEGKRPEVSSTT